LRDKSSSPDAAGVLWHRTKLWWPVERIPVLLEVVHPRKLTALEWAMLRVVDAFRDDPPTLSETAEELGIADASFLMDTLREVVRLRALEPRAADSPWKDLPDLAFTASGHDLFRRGQIEAEPAEHGEDLYFDALTDEAQPEPKGIQDRADVPFPLTGPVPQAREAVGLDRAREIIRRFHPEILRGDGEIRSVKPRRDSWPRVVWAPLELELRLSDRGEVSTGSPNLAPAARNHLMSVDPIEEAVLPTASVSGTWGDTAALRCSSNLSFGDWRKLTSRTLATDEVHREVLRLVGTARREVQLHAGWYADEAVTSRVADLAKGGVRVLVVGSPATNVAAFHERPKPGFVLTCATRNRMPAAIVVDGRAGLILDDVELLYGELRPVVELAGVLSQAACGEVRAQFMQVAAQATAAGRHTATTREPVLSHVADIDAAANRVFEDTALRLAVARLGVLGSPEDLTACVRLASELAPGAERVRVLVRLADLAQALTDQPADAASLGPATQAWQALVRQLASGPTDIVSIEMLASLAPRGVDAEVLVGAAIANCVPSAEAALADATRFLVELCRVIDARWGRDTCRGIPAYREHRDTLLRADRDPTADPAVRLAAAKRLFDSRELLQWANHEIASLAGPHDAASLERWSGQVAGFASIAPDEVKRQATQHFQRLIQAQSVEVERLVRAASTILDAPALVDAMMPAVPELAEVLEARRRLAAAGIASDTSLWRTRIEKALPEPTSLSSTVNAAELVDSLVKLGLEVPALSPVGRRWAARAAACVPVPETPTAITWWLSELSPLRPLLDDFGTFAATPIRRFHGQLRAAQARGDSLWGDVVRAWVELGLPLSTLDGIVVEDRGARSPDPVAKDRKKNGRKGR
jgi:hypothetical protein